MFCIKFLLLCVDHSHHPPRRAALSQSRRLRARPFSASDLSADKGCARAC